MSTVTRRVLSVAVAGTALVGAVLAAAPAQAMGTGNPYQDMQVGVTYTVYQPSYTVGLKTPKTGNDAPACDASSNAEENLSVSYGSKSTRNFTVSEGNPMCWDIGVGEVVYTTTIMGAKAIVQAYCDPASSAPCTRSDVKKYGGHLSMTLPAAPGLRRTTVWIETFGGNNLTYAQLVRIARSMRPVG